MGIWEFINSSTEAVKQNFNGLERHKSWLPDDEAKSKIGIFATKLAKNAGHYVLEEGYKSVPGGVAVSNIISKTVNEVKSETSNGKP